MWDTIIAILLTIVIFSIVNYFTPPANKTCGACGNKKQNNENNLDY